ncbi:MAG: DNA mismatch repair endonuclease MutL [Treponema sp.]|nr:DNA mismatch repair endonuclease MutL [Treponema sp.]
MAETVPAVSGESRIRVLAPEESRKIAAGEVIDRPAALVREFLDNAIDADSSQVELIIEEGGIGRTEVIDNGSGMGRADLELCWQTHATSKIRTMEDLSSTKTLGFRGEALAAAAAAAKLEILTSTDGREAWLLEIDPGGSLSRIGRARRAKGSSVRALGLFGSIPARRRFLKREGSEALLCGQVFIDKALAFPAIGFRFIQDGKLKLFLPPAAGYRERYAAALLERREGNFLHEVNAQGRGFTVTILIGGPELFRQDRRRQYIFANGRRIQDYALQQALEYGVQGVFPNGTHPIGAVFVDIDPALADFNIHPAKREARFADAGAVHHAITSALRDFMRRLSAGFGEGPAEAADGGRFLPFPAGNSAPSGNWRETQRSGETAGGRRSEHPGGAFTGRETGAPDYSPFRRDGPAGPLAMEALLNHPPPFAPLPRSLQAAEAGPRYGKTLRLAGRLFNLFILAETGDRFFIIDQHAAHERILYDRFLSRTVPRQELLAPIPFTTDSAEEDHFLGAHREELEKMGIGIEQEEGAWYISALPVNWKLSDGETVEEILKLRTAGENIAEHWAAALACHGAVRDGDYLDDAAALALAEEALALPVPRCPHGRPLWVEMSREDLFKAVRRT